MIERGRLRFLIVAVAGVSLLLVAVSRWAGRLAESDVAAGRKAGPGAAPTRAGAADAAPDLTFYKTLGAAPAPGRRPAAGGGDPVLRPVPGDLVPAGTAYVVQALATRDERQARRLKDRLAGRGLPALVMEDSSGEVPVYRVRIGRWRDRAVAELVAAGLREKEGLDPWVLQEAGP